MTIDDARRVAEELRARRHDVIAAVTRGDLHPAAFATDARIGEVKVVVVAQAVPGVGKVRARRVLEALGVDEAARWTELTPDEQRRLTDALTDGGGPPATGR